MRFLAAVFGFVLPLQGAQYRAIWVDAFHPGYKSAAEIERLIEDASTARANALFVQMRRRADGYFHRGLEPPASEDSYAQEFDALEYLCRKAHEKRIEVHAWAVVMPAWRANLGTPPDPRHIWNAHGAKAPGADMWLTVNERGETQYSIDPGHPEAARHAIEAILEPVRQYPVDGVHLDYIRYPEQAGDWGRNRVALERFRRLYGRTGDPDPGDPRWNEFRRNQVTAMVRQIYIRAHAIRPGVKVSASVIAWGDGPAGTGAFAQSRAYTQVHQDWRGWLAEGILDFAVPMNYFAESRGVAWLDHWLEFEKDNQCGRFILAGLGAFLNRTEQTVAQVKRALAPSANGNRLAGFAIYSYAENNSGAAPALRLWRALAGLPDPGGAPAMPWLERPATATVYGWVTVSPGAGAQADGAEVVIAPEAGEGTRTTVDGTGFFGVVGLAPGRYIVRIEQGGREIYRTTAREIDAGQAEMFHLFLPEPVFAR